MLPWGLGGKPGGRPAAVVCCGSRDPRAASPSPPLAVQTKASASAVRSATLPRARARPPGSAFSSNSRPRGLSRGGLCAQRLEGLCRRAEAGADFCLQVWSGSLSPHSTRAEGLARTAVSQDRFKHFLYFFFNHNLVTFRQPG